MTFIIPNYVSRANVCFNPKKIRMLKYQADVKTQELQIKLNKLTEFSESSKKQVESLTQKVTEQEITIKDLSNTILNFKKTVVEYPETNFNNEPKINELKRKDRDDEDAPEISDDISDDEMPMSLEEQIGSTQKELAKLKYQRESGLAQEAFDKKDYCEMVIHMKHAINIAANVGVPVQEIAQNYFWLGHAYHKCRQMTTIPKLKSHRNILLSKCGELAYANLQTAIKLHPQLFQNSNRIQTLVYATVFLKKYDEAFKIIDDNGKYSHIPHLLRGYVYYRKNSYKDAYIWLCKGFEQKSINDIKWWIIMVNTCKELGKFDEALKNVNMALEQHPTNTVALEAKTYFEQRLLSQSGQRSGTVQK